MTRDGPTWCIVGGKTRIGTSVILGLALDEYSYSLTGSSQATVVFSFQAAVLFALGWACALSTQSDSAAASGDTIHARLMGG